MQEGVHYLQGLILVLKFGFVYFQWMLMEVN